MNRYNVKWDILSVYPYNEYNMQDILCKIYTMIEELKANGNVIPTDLIPSVEKLKEEMIEIKQQMSVEVQSKIDNAIKELNDLVNNSIDNMEIRYSYNTNIIKDYYITDYKQQLTAGDDTEHQNIGTYGKCELHVRDGIAILTGLLKLSKNASEIDEGNITLVKGCIATKQVEGIMTNTTAYQITHNNYASSVSVPLVLQKNGNVTVDKAFMEANTNNKEYISMYMTLPVVKSYVKPEHLSSVNSDIDKASDLMQEDTSCVVIACDSHIRPTQDEYTTLIEDNNSLYIPKYLNYINSRLGAFALINNGDTLTESFQVKKYSDYTWLMDSVRKMYNENTLFVLGNHDDQSLLIDNGTVKNVSPISIKDFNRYLNKGKTGISFAGNNQPYFVADDTEGRCKHIILNSHDREGNKIGIFEYSNGQLKWLIRQLIKTPSNYSILLYSHTSPLLSSEGHRFKNAKVLHQILKAYKERSKSSVISEIDNETISFDFTNAKGLIAGIISGHEHHDKQQTIDGINYTIETSTSPEDRTVPTYTIALVDNKHRKLRLLRCGQGRIDQELSY